MGRAPCCDKANVKKGPWSPEEDAKLKEYIERDGTGGNWIALPQKAGLRRCGKSCRLRWLNYLRPNIKHGEFSDEEDQIICALFAAIGSRWSIIAGQLPGRTDNDIKNYWNTKLKKKLMAMGLVPRNKHQLASHFRKPSSHSPFPSNPYLNPPLSPSLAENFNNPNLLYLTGTTPHSTLDFTSATPNFSNENPSSSSVTTDNSLLMNPSVYYPVKESNILVFGSEGSSNSSSDHGIKQESAIGNFHNYFAGSNDVEPSINDDQGFIATGFGVQGSDHVMSNNFWADKLNEDFGESILIHGAASVFGTSSTANANKDEEKDMYYF